MRAHKYDSIAALQTAGITYQDATALRRISMTLQRWFEMECGDGNSYGSWAIVRGRSELRHGEHAGGHGPHRVFLHDDDGKPFLEHHHYMHGHGKDSVSYSPMPDRESGARKRLATIMARYPQLRHYVQTDPRGASLYVLRPGDVPDGASVDSCYSRGIVVCK